MNKDELERVATILRNMPIDERSALIEESCESALNKMEPEEAARMRACIKKIANSRIDRNDRLAKIRGLSERAVKETMLIFYMGGFFDESDHSSPGLPLE